MRLRPPSFGRGLISRRRVHDALASLVAGSEGQRAGATVVVAAPAGAGKTAALSEWAEAVRGRGVRVAWLALLPDDNDPEILAADLCAALTENGDAELVRAIAEVDTTPRASPNELASAITTAVDRCAGPIVLVIDDVQELHHREPLAVLELLARFRAERLSIVVVGRYEPAVGLNRLRLEGGLIEVATDDLAFSPEEAETLLAQHGMSLDDGDLAVLMERTAGWAAGLRMAAIALTGSVDVSARIADFSGDTRNVADYLADEILIMLSDAMRTFMIATAVLDGYFTVESASTVSTEPDAGRTLDELVDRNVMLTRHEGAEAQFSYHPLLRSYLLAELERQPETVRAGIHARAAHWYAAAGKPILALEHIVGANCPDDELSETVLRLGIRSVLEGQSEALSVVLSSAPQAVRELPGALLAQAAADLDRGDPTLAGVSLDRCSERGASAAVRTAAASLRLQRSFWGEGEASPGGGVPDAVAAADTGVAEIDTLALLTVGRLRVVQGDFSRAAEDLERGVALAKSIGFDRAVMAALSMSAMVGFAGGTVTDMRERSGAALEFAHAAGLSEDGTSVTAHQVAAWAAYQQCDTEAALDHLTAAENAAGRQTLPSVRQLNTVLTSIIGVDRSERPHRAAAELRECLSVLDWQQIPGRCAALALLAQLQLALQVGEIAWAKQALTTAEELYPDTVETELIRTVLQLQRGRTDTARGLLRSLLRGAFPALTQRSAVDCLILESLLAESNSDQATSHRAMARALEVAAPERLIRPFRDGGPTVAEVLSRGLGRFGHAEDFARAVIAKLEAVDTPRTVLLTARELELLAELPSMRTTEEIAAALFVSVNTVKTHLRSIYRKMDVRSRREAVVAARSTGLL